MWLVGFLFIQIVFYDVCEMYEENSIRALDAFEIIWFVKMTNIPNKQLGLRSFIYVRI